MSKPTWLLLLIRSIGLLPQCRGSSQQDNCVKKLWSTTFLNIEISSFFWLSSIAPCEGCSAASWWVLPARWSSFLRCWRSCASSSASFVATCWCMRSSLIVSSHQVRLAPRLPSSCSLRVKLQDGFHWIDWRQVEDITKQKAVCSRLVYAISEASL